MVGHVLLIGLGTFYDVNFGSEYFCRALVTYFSIHLFILGFVVLKIESDLVSEASHAN